MTLTAEEERKLKKALAEASRSEREAALLSWESLRAFLRSVGLHWLIEKISHCIDDVLEWLEEIFN